MPGYPTTPPSDLAGVRIGNLKGKALDSKVAHVARQVETAKIVVKAPKGGFATSARELHLTVDGRATAHAALAVGRHGNVLARAWHWLLAFVHDREAPLRTSTPCSTSARTISSMKKGLPSVFSMISRLRDCRLASPPSSA